jgi:ABC-type branched-subunit amino acid transport system substrate-binding protein
MSTRARARIVIGALAVVVVATTTELQGSSPGRAAPSVRGVEDGTITVAGLGNAANFADAGTGAAARFARANSTKEVKGYRFEFKELADDKNDPTTALSEARRLVTSEGVFALVPDMSQVTPGPYLTQSQVPWFGVGYDSTYCGKPSDVWGFGISGCVLPSTPPRRLPNRPAELLKAQLAAKGIAQPTIALIAGDQESGKQAMRNFASTYTGAGFDVVYAKGAVPAPPAVVGDYSPFVQNLITADDGDQPDVIYSGLEPGGALALINGLKAQGYTGTFISPFYSDFLLKPLEHAYVFLQYAAFESDSRNMRQLKDDVEAFKPGTKYSLALGGGYLAADMFIAAVKKAAPEITPAAVREAAAHMTYRLEDVAGPVRYPQSFRLGTPACSTLLYDEDGSAFTVVQPYGCSTKTYPVLERFSGD